MNRMLRNKLLIVVLFAATICKAQSEYTLVKDQFYNNAESNEKLFDEDDWGFLMTPLNELSLDKNYILADFRNRWKPQTGWIKDKSFLRLYVRDKKQERPDDSYFEDEYSRYRKCEENGVAYQVEDNKVPYIWPFDKIRLSGTQMSIWQAYLLSETRNMFEMRDNACTLMHHAIESHDTIIVELCALLRCKGTMRLQLLQRVFQRMLTLYMGEASRPCVTFRPVAMRKR